MSQAAGDQSVAFGYWVNAVGDDSTAIGHGVSATADSSMALGYGIDVSGYESVGIGLDNGTTSYECASANSLCIMGGNVGIGTGTPDELLTVDGMIKSEGITIVDPENRTGC